MEGYSFYQHTDNNKSMSEVFSMAGDIGDLCF